MIALSQLAYLLIVAIAWCWAVSQIRLALHELRWPPSWRVNAAQWITVKAFFFSAVGWLAWDDIPTYSWIVYIIAVSHLIVFVHWTRLPSPAKAEAVYLKDAP